MLQITPFYNAFEISADVPEIYMQEFWVTISRHHSSLHFKLNGKSHTVNVDKFRDMLKILPNPSQIFEDLHLRRTFYLLLKTLDTLASIRRRYFKLLRKKNQVLGGLREISCQDRRTTAENIMDKGFTNVIDVTFNRRSEQLKWSLKEADTDSLALRSGSGADDGLVIYMGSQCTRYGSDDEQSLGSQSEEDDEDEPTGRRSKNDEIALVLEFKRLYMLNPLMFKAMKESDEEVKERIEEEGDGEGRDTAMTDAPLPNVQATHEIEDTHVILTASINPEGQQQSSSVTFGFVSNMLNPRPDTGIDLIFTLNTEATSLIHVSVTTIVEPPLVFATTLLPPPTPLITNMQQTPFPIQTTAPISYIPGIVDAYLANKINNAVKTAVQLQSNRLRDEAQAENEDFLNKLDDNIKKIIKEPSQYETSLRHSLQTSLAIAANLSELELKKILIEKMESNKDDEDKDKEPSTGSNRGSKRRRAGKEPKSTSAPKEKTSKTTGKSNDGSKSQHKSVEISRHPDWFQKPAKLPTPDRDWNKTLPVVHEPVQPWLSNLAWEEGSRKSFDELMDTPLDFSAFMMNQLKIDTLTPELLAGPTFKLMKGTCKSLVELEYFFEEVYKATTEQLYWHNPEGLQYPHDLRKPLPLIPNSRGRQTKAAYYGHIKWIKDLVPNTIWSEVSIIYDKHALWGISHWGRKRQQFYGFAANRESARDVYSKRRIIAVTKLQIVKWHGYKHLDWITVRRDDNKLYTFKEGDFKWLRLQDIEDMLILLVQGKLTNLNVEDCLAFGVSLRMFTRSIVIQRRVEDLQLAYSYPRGFIYLNKDKKNRLMRIDELHKFSDGTLRLEESKAEDEANVEDVISIGEIVTRWFTLIVLSALRRSDNENMLSRSSRIRRKLKDGGEVKEFQRSFRHSDTERLSRSDEVLKLKNFKKDATLKLFKSTNQERYEHVGPKSQVSQDGKVH
ncbi:hypothetical protein Tco_0086501 [Tanacetum coccineum]